MNNKQLGQTLAIEMAKRKLREKNIQAPQCVKVFGRPLTITPPDYEVLDETVGSADQILAYHCLLGELPMEPAGRWVSFRDFPGGQFYLEPFRSRTVAPLVNHFKNDIESLRKAMDAFDWQPVAMGDFAARVQAIDNLPILLIYYRGEDGVEGSADVLFDYTIRRIFCTEDAVIMGTRLCRGLIGQGCESCSGCGACDARSIKKV